MAKPIDHEPLNHARPLQGIPDYRRRQGSEK
jgi:hypothetical protein